MPETKRIWMTPIKAIKKAADLIEKVGLAKHTTKDCHGKYCIRGAINFVRNGNDRDFSGISEAEDLIEPHLPKKFRQTAPYISHPVDWNNAPRRTKTQVVELLRKVVKANT